MPQRTCGTSGCPNAHRAKGLCSSCYNRQHQPDRHRKDTVPCGWCGKPTLKARTQRYAGRYCSLTCRDERRVQERARRLLPVLYVGQVARPRRTLLRPRPSQARRWTAGTCAECSSPFVDNQPSTRFCSRICGKRASRRAWKERTDRLVPAHVRAYVYERDRWTCWLCLAPIDRDAQAPHPMSHSVDHVVPQSQGGKHEAGNLRAAHLLCNALRGNRGGNEQLALL